MAENHEKWLRQQGVKIVNQRTLRLAPAPSFMNWTNVQEHDRINWSEQFTTTEEQVYQVELNEHTIEKFERFESTVKHALDYANRYNGRPQYGYSGYGPNDVSDFLIQNRERHLELLKDNSMYNDAWKEFQSIRALLGETPHWP